MTKIFRETWEDNYAKSIEKSRVIFSQFFLFTSLFQKAQQKREILSVFSGNEKSKYCGFLALRKVSLWCDIVLTSTMQYLHKFKQKNLMVFVLLYKRDFLSFRKFELYVKYQFHYMKVLPNWKFCFTNEYMFN